MVRSSIERAGVDVAGGHGVRDVDHRHVRGDGERHAVADADVLRGRPVVGQEGEAGPAARAGRGRGYWSSGGGGASAGGGGSAAEAGAQVPARV